MTNEERNLLSSDPYPGLRPYHEDEQDKFFGRDADAEVLIDKVLTNRLTLLFAASGVGKSSLLQAAVIPRLKSPTGENLEVVYHIDWVSEPVSSVRAAVRQALHSSGKLPEGAADDAGETLAELLEFCGLFVRHPLVLILDQFEEFFRYQRAGANFQPFIEQLTAIITNPQLPVSLVLSMREDFALELNAFKPRLPTILFENFYRLEKLGRVGAREAIVTPVEQVGFRYEPVLLEILLDDLLSRELDRLPNSPAAELLETVEPPYLQIVCAQLWDLNRADPDKLLRLVTYEKAGKAKGILSNYLKGVLQGFSLTEKQLASKAFDHLASQRGVKMAYTAAALAETVRESEAALGKVLDKLAAVRILRTQQRGEATWYELYHDMFSGSIETWNAQWKESTRAWRIIRSSVKFSFITLLTGSLIYLGYDYYTNITNKFLYINPKTDDVEVYQGSPSSMDFFSQQHYIAQTGFIRNQLSIDSRIEKQLISNYQDLQKILIKSIDTNERKNAYSLIGDYRQVLNFVAESKALEKDDTRILSNKNQSMDHIDIDTANFSLTPACKSQKVYLQNIKGAGENTEKMNSPEKKILIESFSCIYDLEPDSNIIDSDSFIEIIQKLIQDDDVEVRTLAMRLAAKTNKKTMPPILIEKLKEDVYANYTVGN